MKRARRFLCAVALLAPVVLATGCLIPYAYPKLDYVPGYDPNGMKATEVRQFGGLAAVVEAFDRRMAEHQSTAGS